MRGNGWTWTERSQPPLVFGDGELLQLFNTEPEVRGLVVAVEDGLIVVSGLELTRRGLMRARHIRFRVPWSAVLTFAIVENNIVITLDPKTAGRRNLVAVSQSLPTWEDALMKKGVARSEP